MGEKSKKCANPSSKYVRTKSGNYNNPAAEFPPSIADNNLLHTIASSVCKKMNKSNTEEAGCAVYGEITPVRNLMSSQKYQKLAPHSDHPWSYL